MKALFICLVCLALGACATTPNNAQPVNAIMGVLAAAATFQASGCIPPIASVDPVVACAPTSSTDPAAINVAFQNCIQATVTQMLLSNIHLPKCQTVPAAATK